MFNKPEWKNVCGYLSLDMGLLQNGRGKEKIQAASICIKLKCLKYRATCLIGIKEGRLPNHAFDTSHSSNGHVDSSVTKRDFAILRFYLLQPFPLLWDQLFEP
jgi:hypothetical protein